MIDFRYHIVSLVAVFIALAVGIALGAGPLREGISDTLEGEVGQLRTERTELRSELDTAQRHAQGKDEALGVVGDRASASTLSQARVGMVVLPGADRNQVAQLDEAVAAAGGTVSLTVDVDDRFDRTQPGDEAAATLAGDLAADLVQVDAGEPPSIASVLGAALAGGDGPGETGAWLATLDRLAAAGYVDLSWDDDGGDSILDRRPPDVLLLVSGGLTTVADGTLDARSEQALAHRAELVGQLAALDAAAIVGASGAEVDAARPGGGVGPLVARIRGERGLRGAISTVDDLESASGRLAAVLALGWELQGEAGHYGFGAQAQAPVPAPPPTRLGEQPAPADGEQATTPVPAPAPVPPPGDSSAPSTGPGDTAAPTP